MRNVWLIIRREYVERVRTKAFLISTLILPLFMLAVTVLPAKLAGMKAEGTRHIVVVTSRSSLGEAVKRQLTKGTEAEGAYRIEIDDRVTEGERELLRSRVSDGSLDGFLWLSDDAIASRKVTYAARETSDFIEDAGLGSALTVALMKERLAERGIAGADAENLLKDVNVETVKIQKGKESSAGGMQQFFTSFMMAFLLYFTLLVYGMAVMRSVLEEKSSRVMEVVLSSATSRQLMAGKVLGVGAVGLTQIAIWLVIAGALATPGLAASREMRAWLQLPPLTIAAFCLFFVLGYLLYSGMYAALGAMVNSEQEAQQWQFFVTLPIVVPIVMLTFVIRQPNSTISTWASMVPFFAPILMYLRIVVQTPPLWQIGLSLAVLVATIYGVLVVCSRIYRVGILMYGKRPTLPEIVKWLRYA
ncbi:MAG TPA: ABC transporter permease [Terriglobales bacterium]|nr:ABC transporter permease [Terriglobales bacterium]